MAITVSSLQANLVSINAIANEIENIASLITFLPSGVVLAIAELKLLQAVAPSIIADVTDVITKIESTYATIKAK